MPFSKLYGLIRLAKPLTSEEAVRILERDLYRCRYCGLDGLNNFENSLIMTVDFVQPRARKGAKSEANLVTACRPCNLIKGKRVFRNFEEAKAYVLFRRAELQKDWDVRMTPLRTGASGRRT